jgi:ribosomal protein L11 methyltransferase
VVESSALLKRRTSKGYRGFESLPHRVFSSMYLWRKSATPRWLDSNEAILQARADGGLAVIERPGRKRLELEVSCKTAKHVRQFRREFGGQVKALSRDWLERLAREQRGKPLKVGKRLMIVRSRQGREANSFPYSDGDRLVIPAGPAFGTGDHATTAMSLRLLEEVSRKLKPGWSLVDLGTGSGILALAAKRFWAKRVIGIDNDPRAVATARENARLNGINAVLFRIADVRKWILPRRIDIVTANLFSELLIEILPKLKGGDQLILSGILRAQEREVRRALRLNKIDIVSVRRREKWIAILARQMEGRAPSRPQKGRHGGRPSKRI